MLGNGFISTTYGWHDDSNNNIHDAIYYKIWLEGGRNVQKKKFRKRTCRKR